MSATWTCDRNHRWSIAGDAVTIDWSPTCPECGGPGRLVNAEETLAPTEQPPEAPPLTDVSVPGYELLAELGRGAMGVVYRARDSKLGRPVALKMILAGGHASAADRARFEREAEAVAALRHPNIVQIYAVGESGGLPYCALEFIDGGNLADHAAGKPLPPERAAGLVEQLAHGVGYAHDHGIVHRDLKPANVLLDTDGTPKVADFGLAKKVGSATGPTATGAVLGTPAYMAPEQAGGDGKTVGPAADVYALGAILYELLTGRPPFRAATPIDTILQVVTTEPPSPRTINPKVPRDLETVTLKCLRKEPDKRYASAAELAEDLSRWRSGKPVTARPRGRGERLLSGMKRYRAGVIAVASAAVATVFILLPPRRPAEVAKPSITGDAPPSTPAVLTAATPEQAREAVVTVQSRRPGTHAIGNGFLAVEPGIVVTSLTVLGMDHPLTPPPDSIDVTVKDGPHSLRTVAARLLSIDRTESLACLQTSPAGMPAPFALGRSADLHTGQRVYLAEAPRAGMDQKVDEGTITEIKAPLSGPAKYYRVSGIAAVPGAAVYSEDGRLAGATYWGGGQDKDAFVAPSESVGWLLRERVQWLRAGQPVIADGRVRLPVAARVADPLNRLWKLSLEAWADDPDPARGGDSSGPGNQEPRLFPLSLNADDRAGPGEDRDFIGMLEFPPLPAGKAYRVRPCFRTASGGEHFDEASTLPDGGPPVRPVPARLAFDPAAWETPQRNLTLRVRRQMSFGTRDASDSSYEAIVSEQPGGSPAGAAARLHWQLLSYKPTSAAVAQDDPARRAMAAVAGNSAEADLAADGQITAVRVDLDKVPAAVRPRAQGVARDLTETLKAVNRPFTKRDLRPGDSWPAESQFVFPTGQAPVKGTFHLKLTYAGSRDRDGRREAIIEVTGKMDEKSAAGTLVGRTIGGYAVDVSSGLVRLAHVETDLILDLDMPSRFGNQSFARTKMGMVVEMSFGRGEPVPAVLPLPNNRLEFRPPAPFPH